MFKHARTPHKNDNTIVLWVYKAQVQLPKQVVQVVSTTCSLNTFLMRLVVSQQSYSTEDNQSGHSGEAEIEAAFADDLDLTLKDASGILSTQAASVKACLFTPPVPTDSSF